MPIKYLYHSPSGLEHGLSSGLEPSLKPTLELVLSEHLSHNYPWHIHLQHCVVSLLLDGEASLGLANNLRLLPQKQLKNTPINNAWNQQNKVSCTFFNLRKGQYFIIPAGQKHCLSLTPFSRLVSICLPVENSKTKRLNDFNFACQKLTLPPNLQKVCQKIKSIIATKSWNETQQSPTEQAQLLIGEHNPSELTLKTMAMLAGYSPWHFLRLFRKQTGLTPHAYLLARKLSLARRLLREETGELAKTAQEAGFYDQSHMFKLFKQQHGLTPREFQKASYKLAPQKTC